jgi:maleate isomerase
VDAICWNGTSGSWLGLDRDRALCALIKQETGIPATSAVLAMVDALRAAKLGRIGLVTPYVERVQRRIAATLAAEGFDVVAERHLDLSENFAFAQVSPAQLAAMMREVAVEKPQAILVLCTNLRAAPLSDLMERETGIPVLDSTAAALLGGLNLVGIDPVRLRQWGMLFGGLPVAEI